MYTIRYITKVAKYQLFIRSSPNISKHSQKDMDCRSEYISSENQTRWSQPRRCRSWMDVPLYTFTHPRAGSGRKRWKTKEGIHQLKDLEKLEQALSDTDEAKYADMLRDVRKTIVRHGAHLKEARREAISLQTTVSPSCSSRKTISDQWAGHQTFRQSTAQSAPSQSVIVVR